MGHDYTHVVMFNTVANACLALLIPIDNIISVCEIGPCLIIVCQ